MQVTENATPENQRLAWSERFQDQTRKCTNPNVKHIPAAEDQMTVVQLMCRGGKRRLESCEAFCEPVLSPGELLVPQMQSSGQRLVPTPYHVC